MATERESMSMNAGRGIRRAVENLLAQYPPQLEFPIGTGIDIPTIPERELLAALRALDPISDGAIDGIRAQLGTRDAYAMVTFAVRMAVHAARIQDGATLKAALAGLVMDDGIVDWRDILVALSIVEDCAQRTEVQFDSAIREVAKLASAQRRSTIVDGYLTRSPDMRRVEVMGFEAVDTGNEPTFRPRR